NCGAISDSAPGLFLDPPRTARKTVLGFLPAVWIDDELTQRAPSGSGQQQPIQRNQQKRPGMAQEFSARQSSDGQHHGCEISNEERQSMHPYQWAAAIVLINHQLGNESGKKYRVCKC